MSRTTSTKPNSAPVSAGIGHNALQSTELVAVAGLRQDKRDPWRCSAQDSKRIQPIVQRYGSDLLPIVVGADGRVIHGWGVVLAARELGLTQLRCIRKEGLSEPEEQALSLALNRLYEIGSWDEDALASLVADLEKTLEGFSVMDIGFTDIEIDVMVGGQQPDAAADEVPAVEQWAVTRPGDLWLLAGHRISCGDATRSVDYEKLLDGRRADIVFTDPPYGCEINGFVARQGRHREFVQGSGQMSSPELAAFFGQLCAALGGVMRPGALAYLCIDWRSQGLLAGAAEVVFGKLINLCVWVKDRAGMGSLYRSRHELVLVFRAPGDKHRNNVELGRHGRNRTNVWDYPSAASFSRSGREGDLLSKHPTPKPVALVSDAILDCTARGEIVLDPFLGSGTTLIAAERTGRVCCAMDLDPLYVDLAIRRWQDWTGGKAVHAENGRTFDELAAEAQAEEVTDA